MKILNRDKRNMIFNKRRRYMMTLDDMATVLNISVKHAGNAQLGRGVPDEVADAIDEWILRDSAIESDRIRLENEVNGGRQVESNHHV